MPPLPARGGPRCFGEGCQKLFEGGAGLGLWPTEILYRTAFDSVRFQLIGQRMPGLLHPAFIAWGLYSFVRARGIGPALRFVRGLVPALFGGGVRRLLLTLSHRISAVLFIFRDTISSLIRPALHVDANDSISACVGLRDRRRGVNVAMGAPEIVVIVHEVRHEHHLLSQVGLVIPRALMVFLLIASLRDASYQ